MEPRESERLSVSRPSRNRFLMIFYSFVGSTISLFLVVTQYLYYKLFGTNLFLGWDTPTYAILGRDVILHGPIQMAIYWGYTQLYPQLVGAVGFAVGSTILSERVLPLIFGFILIVSYSLITYEFTKNVHLFGFTAIITALTPSFIRQLADLHRGLAAVSLATLALWVYAKGVSSGSRKRSVIAALLAACAAMSEFEVYAVFALSLIIVITLDKRTRRHPFDSVLFLGPMTLLLPLLFTGYAGSLQAVPSYLNQPLSADSVLSALGTSWVLLPFWIAGLLGLGYLAIRERNIAAELLGTWNIILLTLATGIALGTIHLSSIFEFRSLIIIPSSILITVPVYFLYRFLARHDVALIFRTRFRSGVINDNSASKGRLRLAFPTSFVLAIFLVTTMAFLGSFAQVNSLTPFIPNHLAIDAKFGLTANYLTNQRWSEPILLLYGDSATTYWGVYRGDFGATVGDHFAYYGKFENLLKLEPTPFPDAPETYLSNLFVSEIQGAKVTNFYHAQPIQSLSDLASHPIVIVGPELYGAPLPYWATSYEVVKGIFVIPPHPSAFVSPAPAISAILNDSKSRVFSQNYTYVSSSGDVAYSTLAMPPGLESIALQSLPEGMTQYEIFQAQYLSFPDWTPHRLDGSPAVVGNDPCENAGQWVPTHGSEIQIDRISVREGNSSLEVTGPYDSYGDFGASYLLGTPADLGSTQLLEVWAKANSSSNQLPFSVELVDGSGGYRVFFSSVKAADGTSISGDWKRFPVWLDTFTAQSPSFDVRQVSKIFFYLFQGKPGGLASITLDDITIDRPSSAFFSKARMKPNEPLTIILQGNLNPPSPTSMRLTSQSDILVGMSQMGLVVWAPPVIATNYSRLRKLYYKLRSSWKKNGVVDRRSKRP